MERFIIVGTLPTFDQMRNIYEVASKQINGLQSD